MPSATEIVKRWGEFLDQVRGGVSLTITSHGRPVARLLPPPREATAAELESYLSSLPNREAVAAAVESALAALASQNLAVDRPYLLRATAALASGAYLNKSPRAEAVIRAALRNRKAAAPDPGAAA